MNMTKKKPFWMSVYETVALVITTIVSGLGLLVFGLYLPAYIGSIVVSKVNGGNASVLMERITQSALFSFWVGGIVLLVIIVCIFWVWDGLYASRVEKHVQLD